MRNQVLTIQHKSEDKRDPLQFTWGNIKKALVWTWEQWIREGFLEEVTLKLILEG